MKLNKLIDIDLSPTRDILYSGLCLKENRHVFILVNYDIKTKCFDGFSVFRAKEISKYRNWTRNEISKIKKDNRGDFKSALPIENMNTFYSTLKYLDKGMLISIFTDNLNDEYFVAKIISLTKDAIALKLIDQNGKFIRTKRLKLADINYFSFLTSYEKQLANNTV
jgi:hypothetical protein